jgi:hypothetical protein
MAKVTYVRADQLVPGDIIANPSSGTKYEVAEVSSEDGYTNIQYVPKHGCLGVRVRSGRPMARWRKEDS